MRYSESRLTDSPLMPSLHVPVTIASDYALTLPTWHQFAAGAPPVVGLGPCFELPVPVAWGPGAALLQNKLSKSVSHRGMPLALEGHDCGHMIPHISIPPLPFNTLLPFQIMFSSRKMAVSSSTVKADGAQVACQLLTFLPMLACADPVTLPTATTTNLMNNVQVGVTPVDILVGVLGYAFTLMSERLLLSKEPKPMSKMNRPEWLEKFALYPSWKSAKKLLVKNGAAALSGASRILLTGDGEVRLKAGSDYVNVGTNYKKGLDGTWSVSYHATAGVPAPLGAAAVRYRADVKSDPDGSTSKTASWTKSSGPAAPAASASVRTTDSTKLHTNAEGDQSVEEKSETEVIVVAPFEGYHSRSQEKSSGSSGQPGTSAYEGGHELGRSWGQPL